MNKDTSSLTRRQQLAKLSAELHALEDDLEAKELALKSHASSWAWVAIQIGHILRKVKAEIGHGHWQDWVENNCKRVKIRQAQIYCGMAEAWDAATETQRAALLESGSLRGFIKALEEIKHGSGNESGETKSFPIEQQILNRFCREFDRNERHYEAVKSQEVFDAIRLKAAPFVARFFPEVEPMMRQLCPERFR